MQARRGRIGRFGTRLVGAVLACVVVSGYGASPALAQDDENILRPPAARDPDRVPVIQTFLGVVLLAAAGIGVNLIPSKRGHQD